MANRVTPTPRYADNSSGSPAAACIVWRSGDADSMSARDIYDPTTDAGYTYARGEPILRMTGVDGQHASAGFALP